MDNTLSHSSPYAPEYYVDQNAENIPTRVHHSQRDKKPPEIFTFEKNHNHHVDNRTMKDILICVLTMGGVPDYQYIQCLMLNQDGTLSNDLPNFHFTFKASKNMTQTLQHFQKI